MIKLLKRLFGVCTWYDTGDYYHFTTSCDANCFSPCGGKSLKGEICPVCSKRIVVSYSNNNENYEE